MAKKGERRQVSITISGERKYFRGKTLEEAKAKRDAYVAENKRTVIGSNILLKDWIDKWYDIISPTITANTMESYKRVIDKHILPLWGEYSLDTINHIEVRAYMNKLLKDGLSVRTANYFLERFKAILTQAVNDNILARNPLKVLKKAKEKEKKSKAIITVEQLEDLLAVIPDEQLKRIIRLDFATGLSRSELLGLRWEDINYTSSTLSIEQTIIKLQSRAQISSLTKRPSRRRTIYIDSNTIALLKEQHKYQLRKRTANSRFVDRGLIFCDKLGAPIKPDTITDEVTMYGERAKLPKGFTLNSIRHTHATMLLQNGINLKVIQQRLGHSSIVTTMQTYAHATPLDEIKAADKIKELMTK